MTGFIPAFTTNTTNRQIVLNRRPSGSPGGDDFIQRDVPVPVPEEGTFLVRNLYLSADPVQRGWATNPALTPIGAPMRALAVGVVIDSREASITAGDVVYGFFGWQDYALATPADLLSHIPSPRAPLPAYAGVLGMPGVTAWLALHDIAPPAPGQAILVSTAAGSVGSVVGQIARQAGAFVVGLTGSDDKVTRCIDRFGYHAAFNYKNVDLAATLATIRPDGFDTYFDNTGGPILDTAIRAMARRGRIVQCGTAATPSWNPPPTGLRNEREILMRALTWSGFVIFDHAARFGTAVEQLTDMMVAGQLHHDESVEAGLPNVVGALEDLFTGANSGKKLIYIGED
ncbi:NADP-dependent oxidoreductase [Sphingobium sp.]|uniref:NADP-dependent oxidoreductase n=1 Tax=Sphingobium sp. TaxID=1912891 RepID=UPI0028BE062D|nr:NADP-dependent oxidoreductase [Sphingobium sp.]